MSVPTNMSASCNLLRCPSRPLASSTVVSLFFMPFSGFIPPAVAVPATFSAATAGRAPSLSLSPKPTSRNLASKPLSSTFPLAARSICLLRHSVSSEAFARTPLPHLEAALDGDDEDDEIRDIDEEREEEGEYEELGEGIVSGEEEEEAHEPEGTASVRPSDVKKGPGLSLNLSVKEKKELASYAHSLGKKLKCQLVGKSGVTDNVAASFIETLEANELLKIKIHRTCPGELDDVVNQLEVLTGSVVVGQIGRTVILYRPSLTKLKAEEKKKQAQRVFMKRRSTPRPAPVMQNGGGSRTTARARRRGRSSL